MDLEELYDKVYRYCYMKLRHPQAAEDITQEAFLRFLRVYEEREIRKRTAYLTLSPATSARTSAAQGGPSPWSRRNKSPPRTGMSGIPSALPWSRPWSGCPRRSGS